MEPCDTDDEASPAAPGPVDRDSPELNQQAQECEAPGLVISRGYDDVQELGLGPAPDALQASQEQEKMAIEALDLQREQLTEHANASERVLNAAKTLEAELQPILRLNEQPRDSSVGGQTPVNSWGQVFETQQHLASPASAPTSPTPGPTREERERKREMIEFTLLQRERDRLLSERERMGERIQALSVEVEVLSRLLAQERARAGQR